MKKLVFGAIVLLAVLHQDFWWRADHRTLVFGFVPVSLAWHIGVSIAACALWGLACRYCWPAHLADENGFITGDNSPEERR